MPRKNRTPEEIATHKAEANARAYARAEAIVKDLPGVTIGYIGNCSVASDVRVSAHDDRSWYIFLPHPGRVGTREDSLGGFPTEDRGKLAGIARILAVGVELERKATIARMQSILEDPDIAHEIAASRR